MRRTKRVTITDNNRDRGKVFEIREMSAHQAEWWFTRAVLACANSSIALPEVDSAAGAAAFEVTWRNALAMGFYSFRGITPERIKPLLDEMEPLIRWKPPGGENVPLQDIFPGDDSQIEEVTTWYTLRYELIQLHVGFSLAAAPLTTGSIPETTPA